MAALRATQGFIGIITGATLINVYTVPAGKRFIVKSVTVQHVSSGSVNIQMRTGATGTVWNWVLGPYAGGSDRTVTNFWLVLNPGDTLGFQNVATGHQVDVTVSGSIHTV